MSSVSVVEERVITKAVTMPIQASVLHGPRDIRLVRLSFFFFLFLFYSVLFCLALFNFCWGGKVLWGERMCWCYLLVDGFGVGG